MLHHILQCTKTSSKDVGSRSLHDKMSWRLYNQLLSHAVTYAKQNVQPDYQKWVTVLLEVSHAWIKQKPYRFIGLAILYGIIIDLLY